jgi:YHYH protein
MKITTHSRLVSPHLPLRTKRLTVRLLSASLLTCAVVMACGGGGSSVEIVAPPIVFTDSSANCTFISESLKASTTGSATSTCDGTYAYVASNGLATHPMMNGITATNLQVPLAVDFSGANAWKIPLAPAIAASPTSVIDGPVGVAINGVPIFNPCKQGGCQNGDTKVQGELDTCNGHAGRGDDYHYHAAPTCMMAGQAPSYWNTHPVGWALDGFAIFGYNNADGSVASRDSVCGGNTSAVVNGPAGYSYHVTDASPYVLSCLRGTPSTAARGQPLRQPPVTPFRVSNMTLSSATDGYQVLQFTSNESFITNTTGANDYTNAAGSYKIRYKALTGTELAALLTTNPGKTACWSFQFKTSADIQTQTPISYCR